jgi:hypothetical protein
LTTDLTVSRNAYYSGRPVSAKLLYLVLVDATDNFYVLYLVDGGDLDHGRHELSSALLDMTNPHPTRLN